MKTPRALSFLAALSLAACSSSSPPSGSATATLFGPDARLDSWKTSVVEGIHVHATQPEQPCGAADIMELMNAASVAMPDHPEQTKESLKNLGRGMGSMMEAMLEKSLGPAHGGAGRTVLALRRLGSDGTSVETLIVDLPRLQAGENERLFKAGDLKATYARPPGTPGARLERGWVRTLRGEAGRSEYDLFLVLKPVGTPAPYESMQVVTRVEWPPR